MKEEVRQAVASNPRARKFKQIKEKRIRNGNFMVKLYNKIS